MDTDGTARSPGVEVRAGEASGRSPLRIFINYRHEDMPFAASTLYRELRGRFGAENIFFDAGTLRPGMQFPEKITWHLSGTAGAFLALIGPEWLPEPHALSPCRSAAERAGESGCCCFP
jgi:TIR domain